MMVNNVQATYQTQDTSTSTKNVQDLGKDDFLKLLIFQLQNQNPLEPMKNEEFVAQLAQFNSLEQMQNLNKTMSSMTSLQVLTQTSSLIGRVVEAMNSDSKVIQGVVKGVAMKDGVAQVVIYDGTQNYSVTSDKILSVQ
jgi:flagellar basal-body rod modification protein FlgD